MIWSPWRAARFLAQIALAVILIAVFFAVYNRLVVDANLKNLKLALKVLGQSDAAGKAEAAMTLVDQNLLYQMSLGHDTSSEVVALEYTKGVLAGDPRRPVGDAQAMVSAVLAQRTEHRSGFAELLGDLNDRLSDAVQRVILMPRVLGQGRLSGDIDAQRLSQAIEADRSGDFAKAEALYRTLLQEFPTYSGRGDLNLRLGYLYHRHRSFADAERTYLEILRDTQDLMEAKVARQLLGQLGQSQQAMAALPGLQRQLEAAPDPEKRQGAAFELALKQMATFDFDGAISNFQLAAETLPKTPTAAQALFRRGWCLKYLGRYDEALPVFEALGQQTSNPSLAAAATAQLAATHRALGQYQQAEEALTTAANQTQDKKLASMLTAQAGSVALLDENNPTRAEQSFHRLEQSFPASSVSSIRQTMEQIQAQKAEAPPIAPVPVVGGPPVLGWMETALPALVQTFATRLADHMVSSGRQEYTRRLTESDFENLVIHRVYERFPGQLRDLRIRIEPDGFRGSVMIRLVGLWFPAEGYGRVSSTPTGRLHVDMLELTAARIPVPRALLTLLGDRVNLIIDQMKLPLRVYQFTPVTGGVDVRVSLNDASSTPSP